MSEESCGNADREVRCEAVGYKIMIQCDERRDETKSDRRGIYSTMYVWTCESGRRTRSCETRMLTGYNGLRNAPGPGRNHRVQKENEDATRQLPSQEDKTSGESESERARTSTRGRNAQSDDVDESRELLGLRHPPAKHASCPEQEQ